MVSADVKQHWTWAADWLELRSCVKVEVAVLGSPSLISLMVSVDVKRHWIKPKSTPTINHGEIYQLQLKEAYYVYFIMSNDCELNRSQNRCFTTFCFICILFTFVIWSVLLSLSLSVVLNWSDSKGKFSFDVFIMNNTVLLYLYWIFIWMLNQTHIIVRIISQHTTTSWNETESLCERRDSVELSADPFLKLGAGTGQLVERPTVNSEPMLTRVRVPRVKKGFFSHGQPSVQTLLQCTYSPMSMIRDTKLTCILMFVDCK